MSICIPTYDRVTYIDQVLEGAIHQTYDNYEVLIGDSSHHDEIEERVKRLISDKIRYIRYPASMTQPGKFNELIKEATSDWVVFLCDDDLIEADYLKYMSLPIPFHPEATLVRCRFKLIDAKDQFLRLDPDSKHVMGSFEFLSKLFLPEKYFFKMNITGILFKKDVLLKWGGFVELPTTWHLDLMAWAVLGSKGDCIYDSRPLCSVRLHPASITSDFQKNMGAAIETNRGAQLIFDRILSDLETQIRTEEDWFYWNEAKKNMQHYMSRHLSRCFDQEFMAVLDAEGEDPRTLNHLFSEMKELNVPIFNSTMVYRYLGLLPLLFRKPLVHAFKEYKLHKWCS